MTNCWGGIFGNQMEMFLLNSRFCFFFISLSFFFCLAAGDVEKDVFEGWADSDLRIKNSFFYFIDRNMKFNWRATRWPIRNKMFLRKKKNSFFLISDFNS